MLHQPTGQAPEDPERQAPALPLPVWARWGKYWRRRPFLALGVVSLVIAVALIAIVRATGAVDGNVLWPELTKALISVLTVAVLGGIIKFLLDQYVREREERKLETDFLLQSIAEIEDIRSSIEHARFLIAAHRSARSYRDQMQNIIGLQVRTNELQRRIEMHWLGRGAALPQDVLERFTTISGYLAELAREYKDHYKPVSDAQRIDEAVVEARIKKYAESASTQDSLPDYRPAFTWRAWESLTDRTEFPHLNSFIDLGHDSAYERAVRPQCRIIVGFLTDALNAVVASRPIASVRLLVSPGAGKGGVGAHGFEPMPAQVRSTAQSGTG